MTLAKNKIIFNVDDGTGDHVTLHAGPGGEADVHQTRYLSNGEAVHTRLFAIKHEVLVAVLQELAGKMPAAMMGCITPLTVQYVRRRRIQLVVGVLSRPEVLCRDMKVRKRKLRIDPDAMLEKLWVATSLDELFDLEPGYEIFTLVERRPGHEPRIAGHGFAVTSAKGYRRLVWIPLSRLNTLITRMSAAMQDSYARHGEAVPAIGSQSTAIVS